MIAAAGGLAARSRHAFPDSAPPPGGADFFCLGASPGGAFLFYSLGCLDWTSYD